MLPGQHALCCITLTLQQLSDSTAFGKRLHCFRNMIALLSPGNSTATGM